MVLRILVLEDAEATCAAISDCLGSHLWRLGSAPSSERPGPFRQRNPHDGEYGALAHLLPPDWGPYGPAQFDVCCPDESALERLTDVRLDPELLLEELEHIALSGFSDGERFDIVVVDLALSLEQQEELIAKGGNIDFMSELRDRESDGAGGPQLDMRDQEVVRDIREFVQDLTGYRVLTVVSSTGVPVVSTSYARNPLVRKQLLENGAYAMVPKPVTAKQMAATLRDDGMVALERRARDGTDVQAVVVVNYLMTIAGEVLKAAVSLGERAGAAQLPESMTDVIRNGKAPRDPGASDENR